jgi:hypothetical protein
MMNFQKMMKQAQEMQFRLQEMQEKLADIEINGEAGGGLVKITMTCAGKVTRVDIDDSLMETDKETLEDLIAAAYNTANEAKDEKIKTETAQMMEGLGLPADAAGGLPI